jgi:hypothetical protein
MATVSSAKDTCVHACQFLQDACIHACQFLQDVTFEFLNGFGWILVTVLSPTQADEPEDREETEREDMALDRIRGRYGESRVCDFFTNENSETAEEFEQRLMHQEEADRLSGEMLQLVKRQKNNLYKSLRRQEKRLKQVIMMGQTDLAQHGSAALAAGKVVGDIVHEMIMSEFEQRLMQLESLVESLGTPGMVAEGVLGPVSEEQLLPEPEPEQDYM